MILQMSAGSEPDNKVYRTVNGDTRPAGESEGVEKGIISAWEPNY